MSNWRQSRLTTDEYKAVWCFLVHGENSTNTPLIQHEGRYLAKMSCTWLFPQAHIYLTIFIEIPPLEMKNYTSCLCYCMCCFVVTDGFHILIDLSAVSHTLRCTCD